MRVAVATSGALPRTKHAGFPAGQRILRARSHHWLNGLGGQREHDCSLVSTGVAFSSVKKVGYINDIFLDRIYCTVFADLQTEDILPSLGTLNLAMSAP